MNEDATGSITALQAEIRRLREELEKARGEIQLNLLVSHKSCQLFASVLIKHCQIQCTLPTTVLIMVLCSVNLLE